jgi:excisionase family DNA binding protein
MTDLVVTAAEAASMLRVCERTVRRAVKAGTLPRSQGVGRKLLIPREAVQRAAAGALRGSR